MSYLLTPLHSIVYIGYNVVWGCPCCLTNDTQLNIMEPANTALTWVHDHRSWLHTCIFQVNMGNNGSSSVTVNDRRYTPLLKLKHLLWRCRKYFHIKISNQSFIICVWRIDMTDFRGTHFDDLNKYIVNMGMSYIYESPLALNGSFNKVQPNSVMHCSALAYTWD